MNNASSSFCGERVLRLKLKHFNTPGTLSEQRHLQLLQFLLFNRQLVIMSKAFQLLRKRFFTSFYVDDFLQSIPCESDAVVLASQMVNMLTKGGFNLTTFVTNSLEVFKEGLRETTRLLLNPSVKWKSLQFWEFNMI